MRAVRVEGPGVVELVEVEEPAPADGEVTVRVAAASLCPTDRRLVVGGAGAPRIPGHEAAGFLADGTAVGIHPDVACGRCRHCAAGQENRCLDRASIGLERDGALAERVAVPAEHVVHLNGVDPRLGPLLEPLGCVLHALSLLDVRAGERALVVGAGAMGILATWGLQGVGAEVAVMQRSEPRRRLARELGADVALGPEDDPAAALGAAPTVAVVAAPGAEGLAWALERVTPGGRVHAFAGTPGGAAVDANLVHYRHLTLVGSTGSRVEDYERARDLVASGRMDLGRLPRTTVPLEAVPRALTGPQDPGVLKVMVDVGGAGR